MTLLRLDWDTPAGQTLRDLCLAITHPTTLTLFGSAPLQMMVDRALLSEDVDVFSTTDLEAVVQANHLGVGQRKVGIQVCHELNFRTTSRWRSRTRVEKLELCELVFPDPIDILIGKLHRLEAKDLEAFHVVIKKTGHPTESELLEELQVSVDLFRPNFDEENSTDLNVTTRILWEEVYGRSIDVRAEIIVPALRLRRLGYGHDIHADNFLESLRALGEQRKTP